MTNIFIIKLKSLKARLDSVLWPSCECWVFAFVLWFLIIVGVMHVSSCENNDNPKFLKAMEHATSLKVNKHYAKEILK